MRVQEFVVSFVLPIDEECPALSDDQFMTILTETSTLWFEPYPDITLSASQVRDATPQEAEDFAFVEDDEGDTFTGISAE